jgi:hypothetical protein
MGRLKAGESLSLPFNNLAELVSLLISLTGRRKKNTKEGIRSYPSYETKGSITDLDHVPK